MRLIPALLAATCLSSTALAMPGLGTPIVPSVQDPASGIPTLAEALQFQQSGRYGEAVEAFEAIVAADPNSVGGWFNLGYSRHMLGQLDSALEAHKKAASFENAQVRPTAFYNIACVHALQGRLDDAFAALGKAREVGFRNLQQVEGDSDLEALRVDPRYGELIVALGGTAPATASMVAGPGATETALGVGERALDFLVGDWDVLSGGALAERVSVTRILNQQALRMSAPTHESLLAWVPAAKEWRWTWVSSRGHHDLLSGGVQDGRIVMDQPILRDRPGSIGRCLFENIGASAFQFVWKVSADGGENWTTESSTRWVRQGTVRPVAASFAPEAVPAALAPMVGDWDVTVERLNADQSTTHGVGSSHIWWCEDGAHLHDDIDFHFGDWTAISGTTLRAWNAESENWGATWEPTGGEAVSATGMVEDGVYTEVRSGSDERGAYTDRAKFVTAPEAWSVRVDRNYEDGPLVKGIWAVKATRIR